MYEKEERVHMKTSGFFRGFVLFSLIGLSLAAFSGQARSKSAEDEGTGWLSISTEPYTEIYIGGEKIGIAPVIKHELKAGKYKVKLVNEAEGISLTVVVVIQVGQITKIIKDIKPPPKGDGFLSVMSTPPATVYVDGDKVGLTPQSKIPLKPGKHTVTLISLEDEIQYKQKIVIKPGKHVKIVKSFEAKGNGGTLSVLTDPVTDVYVDGNKIGTTPIGKYKLQPGSYKITFINEDFGIESTTSATVTDGKVTKIVKSFQKASSEKGTLTVMTQPPTAVYVDGKKIGNTPVKSYGLTPGTHEVRLESWKHYIYDTFTVNIEKGKSTKIVKSYEPPDDDDDDDIYPLR
jgi:hypothetical protein